MAVRRVEELLWPDSHEDLILSGGIVLPNGEITSADAISAVYIQSTYGLHHATQPPRYSQNYGYEPEDMVADLGDDVHPLRHMVYTESEILTPLMLSQNTSTSLNSTMRFNEEEISVLRLAARMHDIGECGHQSIKDCLGVIVEDVHFWDKNDQHETDEAIIRAHLYRELYADVIPEDMWRAAEDVMANKGGTFLRDAFNTTEKIGYYTTAIAAGFVALELRQSNPEIQNERFTQLARLGRNVSYSWHDVVAGRAEIFPYCDTVIAGCEPVYQRIHAELSDFPLDDGLTGITVPVQAAAGHTRTA